MDATSPTPVHSKLGPKAELRGKIQSLLREGRGDWKRRSRVLCERLSKQIVWEQAHTVALFAPLPDEPDLLELVSSFEKRFVFPKIAPHGLTWHQVESADALQPVDGRRLLREPADSRVVGPEEIHLMVVPGVAFTLAGARLGRGGGYYDRALAHLAKGVYSVGVCFECQIVSILPMEPHDQAVSQVIWA